jgi:P-type E1-E2 ATPase
VALFGLMDPLKEGITEAIKKVRKANLNVIMVTGDNLDTAKAIARKAGIISKNINNPSDIEAAEEFAS